VQTCVKDLNHFYLKEPALWADDFSYHGFEWIDFRDEKNSVISYLRKGQGQTLLCVHNFTPTFHHDYVIHARGVRHLEEIFNSDDTNFGGSGKTHLPAKILHDNHQSPYALQLSLAPLATMIYRIHYT
jgi:1,4-alpha-glucan branching enzyme